MKAAFTQSDFVLLFPPVISIILHYVADASHLFWPIPTLCPLFTWSGFLTCVKIGKLQDGELSLVRFMWSQGPMKSWEFGRCSWWGGWAEQRQHKPCLLWSNIVSTNPLIDIHFCCDFHSRSAAFGGQIPSLPSFVSIFSCMLICLFTPSISFASETRRFHSVWSDSLPRPTYTPRPLPGTLCLTHPGRIKGAAGLLPGAPGWDDRPLINM